MLCVSATTRPELHVEAGFALLEQLQQALAAQGLRVVDPVMCLLPDPPDDDTMLLDLCAPVPESATGRVVRLPACRLAYVTHRGPYEEIGIAHHAVMAWVHEHGHEPKGPMREIYVDDPAVVPSADIRTEIGVPI